VLLEGFEGLGEEGELLAEGVELLFGVGGWVEEGGGFLVDDL